AWASPGSPRSASGPRWRPPRSAGGCRGARRRCRPRPRPATPWRARDADAAIVRMMRWQWRRRWLQWGAWLAFGGLLFLCAWGFVWEPSQLVQRDYVVALGDLPPECDGLRIDMLADIHTGSPNNDLAKLDRIATAVAGGDADVVLLAG